MSPMEREVQLLFSPCQPLFCQIHSIFSSAFSMGRKMVNPAATDWHWDLQPVQLGGGYLHTRISCNQWMQGLNLAVTF